jgi:hypothetical protein
MYYWWRPCFVQITEMKWKTSTSECQLFVNERAGKQVGFHSNRGTKQFEHIVKRKSNNRPREDMLFLVKKHFGDSNLGHVATLKSLRLSAQVGL